MRFIILLLVLFQSLAALGSKPLKQPSLQTEFNPTFWPYLLGVLTLLVLLALLVLAILKNRNQNKSNIQDPVNDNQSEDLNPLKDEFLASSAYELQTPIHGIIGLAESLIDGTAGDLPDKARRELAMIVSSGRRITNKINDIVDYLQLRNRSIKLKPQSVDLHALCDVVLVLSQPLLGDKDLKLVNKVAKDLPAALADEDRLRQIIINLIDNAIKFTDIGEVVISAECHGDRLKVNISDTGVGIASDKLDNIFSAIENEQDETLEPTGLGIRVSKQLVSLHGGTIEAKSRVGWGSTFSFTLPISKQHVKQDLQREKMVSRLSLLEVETEQPPATIERFARQQNRLKVLLVDDDPVNLQVLHNYLSPFNYELIEATGGQRALFELAKNERFDLVLLDLLMPRVSGIEVCKKIRGLYSVSEVPVIFLTANMDVSNLVECFKVGANDYLNKPVNKHELLTRVETHLKLSDINHTLERQVVQRTAALEESNQKFNTLGKICSEISSTLDLDKLMITVYYRLKELMDVKVVCIGHYEPKKQRIVFRQGIESEMYLPKFQDLMSESNQPAVWCVENKKPVIINDFSRDFAGYFGEVSTPVTKVGIQPKSVMYWPLIVGQRVIGVLTVQSLKKNVYNTPQQDMMKTLASTTAIALDHARAYDEVEQQKLALEAKNAEIAINQNRLTQSEKMASLGTLTAGVAHEINNPTNFVHVSAQNLSVDLSRFEKFILDLAGTDAEESIINALRNKFKPLHQHLATISQGTERIKAIVQDLGAFTHFDGEDKEMTKINDCLKSTLNLVQTEHLELADFVTDFHDDPQLRCFPAKLNQVFMNLMVNAVDAIRDRMRKQETPTRGEVVVSCDVHDNLIHISVKDNGCGIDEQTQKKLFEPFYTTKAVGEGTGLGLSISFGIIEGHGGTIKVESELGVGTTFTVLLPVL